MSAPNAHREGRIREPEPTSGPLLTFNLYTEIRRLESEQPWQAEHTANTIVKYPDLRIILIALKAGGKLLEHRTVGRISIQTLSGLIEVHTPDGIVQMPVGHLLTLDHDLVHDVVAIGDSVFLLTIAWPEHSPRNNPKLVERSIPDVKKPPQAGGNATAAFGSSKSTGTGFGRNLRGLPLRRPDILGPQSGDIRVAGCSGRGCGENDTFIV